MTMLIFKKIANNRNNEHGSIGGIDAGNENAVVGWLKEEGAPAYGIESPLANALTPRDKPLARYLG
jgi:hypothetical protein